MTKKSIFERQLFVVTTLRGISSIAYYSFIPFFSIFLYQQNLLSMGQTSVVVGVCIFMTRAASVLMPPVIRFIGERYTTMFAYLLTIIVFGIMYSYRDGNILVWNILSGLLGVAFSVSTLGIKSIIGKSFTEEKRIKAYSYLNVAVNVGAGLGPVLGGWVISKQNSALPLVSFGLQIISVIFAFFLPQVQKEISVKQEKEIGIRIPGKFLLFLFITSLTWIAYVQLYNVFPIYAQGHFDERLVGMIFSINAVLIILIQIPIGHFLEKAMQNKSINMNLILLLSNMCMAISMLFISTARTQYWYLVFVGVLFFTLSELLWSPLYDTAVTQIRGSLQLVTAFGISGLIWGLAESLGTSFGMMLIGKQEKALTSAPFFIGLLAAVLAGVLGLIFQILSPNNIGTSNSKSTEQASV